MEEVKEPNTRGWWARKRDGRIEWFWCEEITDEKHKDPYIAIYVNKIRDLLPVKKFSGPLTSWFGPMEIPWEEYD